MTRQGNCVIDESGIHQDRVVNDEQGFANELCCTICQGILWKPVSCSSCQHLFCNQCIRKWHMLNPASCPFRCYSFEEKRAPPSIHSLLSRLSIRCRNSSFGCTKVVPYNSIEEHEKVHCEYPSIPCKICGEFILVDVINQHEALCVPAAVSCSLCQCLVDRAEYEEHTDKCLRERMNFLMDRVIPVPNTQEVPTNDTVTFPRTDDNQTWFHLLQNRFQHWVTLMANVNLVGFDTVAQARHENFLTRIWLMLRLIALNKSRALYILFCLLCGGVGNVLGCLLIIGIFVQQQVNKSMYRSFGFMMLFSGLVCFVLPILIEKVNDISIILWTITGLILWAAACSDLPLEYYRIGFSWKFMALIHVLILITSKVFLLVFRLFLRYMPPYISAGCLAWSTVFLTYHLRYF